jgi:hypothetical protein
VKLTADLKSPALIHLKGALFVVIGLLSAFLLVLQVPTVRTAALLALCVWAFCRFYYYLFHVLERYLGRRRFTGVLGALRFLAARPRRGPPAPPPFPPVSS